MKKLLTSLAIICWLSAFNSSLLAQTPWPVMPVPSCTQSYRVVILGSSTSLGTGASPIDSSWANKFRLFLLQQNASNSFTNLSLGGFTTYSVNPTGYVPPAGKPAPDPARNITAALALNSRCDHN
jgi:hypothetical protein